MYFELGFHIVQQQFVLFGFQHAVRQRHAVQQVVTLVFRYAGQYFITTKRKPVKSVKTDGFFYFFFIYVIKEKI